LEIATLVRALGRNGTLAQQRRMLAHLIQGIDGGGSATGPRR
jgi:hypothetical protein